MDELLYNIFGDTTRKVTNTPTVYNNENIGIARNVGKGALDGPIKPQETKKSFLLNAGKPLYSTPTIPLKTRNVLATSIANTPIYSDIDTQQDWFEEIEFTKPPYRLDNYHLDIFEDSFELGVGSPQHSPSVKSKDEDMEFHQFYDNLQPASMEFQQSYECDFFTDNIVMDMDLEHEDDLPKLY